MQEYNTYRKQMSRCYIESLLFCLNYYLIDVPSWNWAYEYRVPPMPSDVYFYISKVNFKIIDNTLIRMRSGGISGKNLQSYWISTLEIVPL